MSPKTRTLISAFALGVALVFLAVPRAQAQDYGAMVQQSMARMNAIIANGQNQVNQMVQQRMQDPQVQMAYRQHMAAAAQNGQQPMPYAQFTYNYIYTRGFSADGIAHARANESAMAANERAAVQRLRDATQARGQAMQTQRDHYFANQQEAGRQLNGQSTYVAPNGQPMVLPHTWQPNTTHEYQGATYGVDASGQYHVLSNGWWYPVRRP
jgi:hypothetical protein